MEKIHQEYVSAFKQYGMPALAQHGYKVEILKINGGSNETAILIERKGGDDLILSFATNHLDYEDGVLVCKSKDRKFHWEGLVLPKPPLSNTSNKYDYMGPALLSDIGRLVKDITELKD